MSDRMAGLIPDSPDRRTKPRLGGLEVEAELRCDGRSYGRVRIRDVSVGGVFVAHETPSLPFRSRIELNLGAVTPQGEIVHVVDAALAEQMKHPCGYGVQLIKAPADVVRAVAAMQQPPPEQMRKRGSDPPSRPLVLVIDDDERVGKAVARALGTIGMRAIWERCVTTGLATFATRSGDITLVITDCLLPDGEGTEIVAKVREVAPSTPIIAMSGVLRTARAHKHIMEAGADEFIGKPFTAPQVCRHALRLVRNAQKDAA